jgi:hypothetical protein
MPEIEFTGDWSDAEIRSIAPLLQKSFGLGDGIPDTLQPPTIATPGTLSARQKKMLELWRKAGAAPLVDEEEPCEDDREDWRAYRLEKAIVGSQKTDPKTGKQYVFTQKHRWQRVGASAHLVSKQDSQLRFTVSDGEFGEGVYFPISPPIGAFQVRLRLEATPSEIITQDKFEEIEQDLTIDLPMALDAAQVKGVVKVEDKPVLMMVRSPHLLTALGVISGSGNPAGSNAHIINMEERPDHIILDVEFVGETADLNKSASQRKTYPSTTHLDGSKLIPSTLEFDRQLIRNVVKQCQIECDNLARVSLLSGTPDFLAPGTVAFTLPQDGVIYVCPHNPQVALEQFKLRMGDRLKAAISAGAIGVDDAFNLLAFVSRLNAEEYLGILLKRYSGAIAIYNGGEIDSPKWKSYLKLLAARGVQYWGSRRAILECMAEDYRCIHNPKLPNLVTLEWDLQCPAIARMCQQIIAKTLKDAE